MSAPGQDRIAGVRWRAVSSDGRETPVRFSIGAPRPDGAGAWGCRLSYEGPSGPVDQAIIGEDAVQALALALALAGRLLHGFVAEGGRVLYGSGDDEVPLEAYFGAAPATADPAA